MALILLVDIDSKIANLALMKISTWEKGNGNKIEIIKLHKTYYHKPKKKDDIKIIEASKYGKIYVSCIFPVNKNLFKVINNNNVVMGGTGIDLTTVLPKEIEESLPDYSIYPEEEHSYGFITRGCIRNCYFCFVPKKEGKLRQVSTIDSIFKGAKDVRLLDNNFLAWDKHKDALREILEKYPKTKLTFYQGLDARLLDDENSELLSRIRRGGEFTFALDDISLIPTIDSHIKIFRKYYPYKWKIKLFIYLHPNMDIKTDIIRRLRYCKNNFILPYLMRDQSCYIDPRKSFYADLACFCNMPRLFKKFTFEEFLEFRYSRGKDRELAKSNVEKSLSYVI